MSEMMINPEALDDLAGRFLTFYIGEATYGVELMNVIEIISIQGITKVPNIPVFIKGIINLRGKIVPVIDVRLKFGVEEKPYDERTCIIVVCIEDIFVGLIVDQVSDVATVDTATLSPVPEMSAPGGNRYVKTISKFDSRLILNIDCEKVLFDA